MLNMVVHIVTAGLLKVHENNSRLFSESYSQIQSMDNGVLNVQAHGKYINHCALNGQHFIKR
jgi:hypothetical protein